MKSFYLITLLTVACAPPAREVGVPYGYMCNASQGEVPGSDIFFMAFEETDEPGYAVLETSGDDIWLELELDDNIEGPVVDETVADIHCDDIFDMKYVK